MWSNTGLLPGKSGSDFVSLFFPAHPHFHCRYFQDPGLGRVSALVYVQADASNSRTASSEFTFPAHFMIITSNDRKMTWKRRNAAELRLCALWRQQRDVCCVVFSSFLVSPVFTLKVRSSSLSQMQSFHCWIVCFVFPPLTINKWIK